MDENSLPVCRGRVGQPNRSAIAKIVCTRNVRPAELVMSDLFDVGKEIILIAGTT
jgi:hypothetical protein